MSESNDLNYDDFAALQALQLLEAGAIADSSDASAIADQTPMIEAAVAAIPYGAPSMPMAADLKDRLFQRIAAIPATEIPADAAISQPEIQPDVARNEADRKGTELDATVVSVRAAERTWVPHEMVEGIMVSLLDVDEVRRIVTCLMKVDAGVQYPNHNHQQIEEIFMLSGDMTLGDQVYTEGDYVRFEAGFAHAPGSRTGCTILIKSPMEERLIPAA